MTGAETMREALKRIRASQPFNAVATATARAALRAAGRESEFVIRHLHRVGLVESRLPNGRTFRLWSAGDDWVSNQVFWRGWSGYESETVPMFYRLAERSSVVLDVGAYVGFFSLLAALANPSARVFAFEPLRPVFERLVRNARLNRLDNLECRACAVSDAEGSAQFFHIAAGLPTSSSLSYDFMEGTDGLTKSTVPVITLDGFARENGLGRVDLVKIDTESTEPAVLAGATRILENDRPYVVCEVLAGRGSEASLTEILSARRYAFFHLTPAGPVRREAVEGHPEWLNYLFVPEERADEVPAEAAR